MMSPLKIRYLIYKELRERKIRHIAGFVLLSIISGLFFFPRFFGLDDKFTDIISTLIPLYQKSFPLLPGEKLSLIIYTDIFFPVFILIPAITSPFLGVLESVIIEKENRTLEGLLSLPLSDKEILFGKMSSSIIAGICITWLLFLIHMVFFAVYLPNILFFHLLSAKWIFLVLILCPVISYIVNSMGIILAIWLKKLNTAGNLGIIILCPFFFFVFLISFGKINLNVMSIIIMSTIGFIIGSGLFFIAIRLFNREKLLLRYH